MTNTLKVSFGNALHGWLPVQLEYGEQRLSFKGSYVSHDSVEALIEALLAVLAYEITRTMIWESEPTQYRFVFTSVNAQISLKVHRAEDHRKTLKELPYVFEVEMSAVDLVTSFWQALQSLSTQQDFETEWKHPFPKTRLDRLKAEITAKD